MYLCTDSSFFKKYLTNISSIHKKVADEHKKLSEVLVKELVESIQALQEKHSLCEKQLNSEGGRLLKEIHVRYCACNFFFTRRARSSQLNITRCIFKGTDTVLTTPLPFRRILQCLMGL